MIHYRFNEIKTAQLGAYLIQAEGRPLKYIKLLKLMYLADREALRRFARPITGDRAVAMRHGPVLSNVYNLIGDDPEVGETFWSRHIKQDAALLRVGRWGARGRRTQRPGAGDRARSFTTVPASE